MQMPDLRVAKHRPRYIVANIHQLFLYVLNNVLKVSREHITKKIRQKAVPFRARSEASNRNNRFGDTQDKSLSCPSRLK